MHEDFLRIVTLFRQYQDTGEDNYKEQAETLLNEIIDNCNNCKDLSYYNGLCGIGSVIEYLIQNNFVEGEADEILEDIDNAVISVINNRPQMGINIKEGLLGLVCYLYERLHYRIKLENSTVFTLKEHTIYLIDWLEDILSDTKAEINYYEFYFILILLHQMDIFNVKVEKMLEYCDRMIECQEHTIPEKIDKLRSYINIANKYSYEELLKMTPHISIVIPLRIDSVDREANLRCVLKYLLQFPYVHIELLEADKERRFFFNSHNRIQYTFVHDEENVFYRTHYLNILLRRALFPIVGIWDADVIIPETQLLTAVRYIMEGNIMCFPYNGEFRYLDNKSSERLRENIETLQKNDGKLLMGKPSVGGAFLVNRDEYLKVGGENEGFYGWGPEDVERVKRLEILGMPIARTNGPLYHLFHERKPDIGIDNQKKTSHNQKMLFNTCAMDKSKLKRMISNHAGVFSYMNYIK